MGSIIAYNVLRKFDKTPMESIAHFITIGSPLGLPLVTQKIRREFGEARVPEKVARWTNIADPFDKVALDCNLSDDFHKRNSSGVSVKEILVFNDNVNHQGKRNHHKSYGYLRTPELSDLIIDYKNHQEYDRRRIRHLNMQAIFHGLWVQQYSPISWLHHQKEEARCKSFMP